MSGAQVAGLMASHNTPMRAARYWRLLDPTGTSAGYWNLHAHTSLSKVAEDGAGSGTNIASGLTHSSTFGFGSPAGYGLGTTTGGQPFGTSGCFYYIAAAANNAMNFDFGSAKYFAYLFWTVSVGFDTRQPTSMTLQYSDDGTNFINYATLTSSRTNACYWRNITQGSTVDSAAA